MYIVDAYNWGRHEHGIETILIYLYSKMATPPLHQPLPTGTPSEIFKRVRWPQSPSALVKTG